MTAVVLGAWEDNSPPWHAARANRIGGSEIGTVCGWNEPWRSRAGLLDLKRGEADPQPMNDAMERGHYLEPAIAKWLSDKSGLTYDEPASNATYVDSDRDFMLYNPDRITTSNELVEIKSAKEKTQEAGWGRAGSDQVPLPYAAQVTWGMHILGLKVCHFGVLFGSPFQFARYKVRYDRQVAEYLITQGEQFMADLIHPTQNGYAA